MGTLTSALSAWESSLRLRGDTERARSKAMKGEAMWMVLAVLAWIVLILWFLAVLSKSQQDWKRAWQKPFGRREDAPKRNAALFAGQVLIGLAIVIAIVYLQWRGAENAMNNHQVTEAVAAADELFWTVEILLGVIGGAFVGKGLKDKWKARPN